jgi:hypothetical protein
LVAFNFSPEFADAVASGAKCQTVRKTQRAKKGDTLQLFTGQRTKACRKLREAECLYVDYVHIAPEGLTFGDTDKHAGNADAFAKRDGFKDYADLVAWFTKKYGSPHFVGYVHRWKV